MKSKEDVHRAVDQWWNKNMVGNLIIYRAPNGDGADCIIERVVKAREMKPETRAAFEMFMDDLEIERGEIARNKSGEPDRVKLTKRF